MVMVLPLPGACSVQLVTDVVAQRQNGVNAGYFTAIAQEWSQRVQAYLDNGGSPEHVPTWPLIEQHKTRFQTLYSHPAEGSAQGAVLDQLRAHDLDLCPACGEPGAPNTLDHYLPKGRYPQFAITPANLFPMCDACQAAKLEKTGDGVTPRYFIHPYFDTFSHPQIIQLTITAPFEAPNFALAPHVALDDVEIALVATHLRELEIGRRYIRFFRNEHRRLLRNVARMRTSGQDVAQTLEVFALGAGDPTLNAWQHVFYRSVLSNRDFMTYLTDADLPPHL
jgi:5-methylcytosine-specific restriction endonuclease McrA